MHPHPNPHPPPHTHTPRLVLGHLAMSGNFRVVTTFGGANSICWVKPGDKLNILVCIGSDLPPSTMIKNSAAPKVKSTEPERPSRPPSSGPVYAAHLSGIPLGHPSPVQSWLSQTHPSPLRTLAFNPPSRLSPDCLQGLLLPKTFSNLLHSTSTHGQFWPLFVCLPCAEVTAMKAWALSPFLLCIPSPK